MKKISQVLDHKEAQAKLVQLKSELHHHLSQTDDAFRGMLEHSRKVGEKLIEAKKLCKQCNVIWKNWISANFRLNERSARRYMEVARSWNHPNIQQARVNGFTINSINQFYRTLKGQKKVDLTDEPSGRVNDYIKTSASIQRTMLHKQIFDELTPELHNMELPELTVFQFYLRDLMDEHWNNVGKVLGYDRWEPIRDFEAEEKRARLKRTRETKRERDSKIKELVAQDVPKRKAAAMVKYGMDTHQPRHGT